MTVDESLGTMLIVQRITTEWTKSSRGGTAATARNATPDAMPLPPIADPFADYRFHDIRFLEWENFDCLSTVKESSIRNCICVEPLFLYFSQESVTTRFVWSWRHCGAPERDSQELFRLSVGEWGRFTCNGRFGAESSSGREWSYHKTVFNVAFVEVQQENLFVHTTPKVVEARLATLR